MNFAVSGIVRVGNCLSINLNMGCVLWRNMPFMLYGYVLEHNFSKFFYQKTCTVQNKLLTLHSLSGTEVLKTKPRWLSQAERKFLKKKLLKNLLVSKIVCNFATFFAAPLEGVPEERVH